MTPAFVRAANLLKLTDLWLTPFISVTGSVPSAPVLRRRLEPYTESGLPLIVQLVGRTPDSLAECAVSLERLGIRAINLNLACPSPTVTSHGAGGALLRSPESVRLMPYTVFPPERIFFAISQPSPREIPVIKIFFMVFSIVFPYWWILKFLRILLCGVF